MVLAPSPRLLPTRKRTSRALRRIPAVHNVPHKLSCSWLRWRPGAFGGEVQRFHLEKRDRTVVVEKIPEDRFSPDAVHGWFERFGTVTNVAVDADSVKALVIQGVLAWRAKIFAGQRALGVSLPLRRLSPLHSRITHHALTPLARTLSGPQRRTPPTAKNAEPSPTSGSGEQPSSQSPLKRVCKPEARYVGALLSRRGTGIAQHRHRTSFMRTAHDIVYYHS